MTLRKQPMRSSSARVLAIFVLLAGLAVHGGALGKVSVVESEQKTGKAALPNLWILSIGVNKYQDSHFTTLNYAVADAEAVMKMFGQQKGKLFGEVHSLLITDGSILKPTYENILDSLDFLQQAQVDDLVVLFLAGLGHDGYFLPHDAEQTKTETPKRSKALYWGQFTQILERPGKKLVFLDTDGSFLGGKNSRTPVHLGDSTVIFAASSGHQLSREDKEWGHGVFTYALLEGLGGKADLNKDKKVSMKELDMYVSGRVMDMTKGEQTPYAVWPIELGDFPVAILEGASQGTR